MEEVFTPAAPQKEIEDFLEAKRQARCQRAEDQKRQRAIFIMQRSVRCFLARKRVRKIALERFYGLMNSFNPEEGKLVPSAKVFAASNFILRRYESEVNHEFLEKFCRYVNWSLDQTNPEYTYLSCGFSKDTAKAWVSHLHHLVKFCVKSMKKLNPDLVADSKRLSVYLSTVVNLLSIRNWKFIHLDNYAMLKPGMHNLTINMFQQLVTIGGFYEVMHQVLEAGLGRPGKFALKRTNLFAVATLTNRPLIEEALRGPDVRQKYIENVLTVPGYIYYVESMCPEGLDVSLLPDILETLKDRPDIMNMGLTQLLSLLANLIHLGQQSEQLKNFVHPTFSIIIMNLLNTCVKQNESSKKTHWHPLLGWVAHPIPSSFLNASNAVKSQIEGLWGPVYLDALFHPLYSFLEAKTPEPVVQEPSSQASKSNFKTSVLKMFKKAMFLDPHQNTYGHSPSVKFNAEVTLKLSKTCELYSSLITSFSLCKLDILTGLCFKNSSKVLVSFWRFIQLLERDAGIKGWVEFLLCKPQPPQEFLIVMFADAMTHFITILDDQEMYEDQIVFKLTDMARMAFFVNQLCYKLISHHNNGRMRESAWNALKTLLMVLYRRDCRRKYCPDDHWLIESSKMTQLIGDIEKGKKHAKRTLMDMPHVLREDARVILFRKWANSEKVLNGGSVGDRDMSSHAGSHLITVQRGRIVEDGYAQLANLSPKALKSTIRVRFQNKHGLDEAGIDQDGVFKEFLEETISAVFNPSLNLFKATSENLLYPSPLSYLHENHLELFEFVGKILAKAIYEGIVVDVHFAPFFLSQILGHQQSALFSAIDELQSLDRQLYNSLNHIKHYDGEVQDLELTFSVDQEVLGEIKTVELIPGGRSVTVNNQNKISYLYLMAHYHLYLQIKEQTLAFLKGFRSIIPNDWIRIFSPPELQRLISGADSAIDLVDLRRNTQYYGGFHDNHRVIVWLWDILEHDFTEEERQLFLKFVTSCSKPPLLGFMNLDPPFSIRCVEVSDDDDVGDTIGSVLRGFLTIGKKDPIGRLPTSSTCFNLLKLPNYQRKSTLREKTRYAITANVGFELS